MLSVAEAAEVDAARDTFAGEHLREVDGPLLLARLEPAPAGHGVDEVVGDVDALAGPAEAGAVGDVALADLAAVALQLRGTGAVAHEAAHANAGGEQRVGEAAADEAGCSGDERAGCDPSRLAAARRSRPAAAPTGGGPDWRRPGSLRPGSLRPGSLRPGSLRPGSLRPGLRRRDWRPGQAAGF